MTASEPRVVLAIDPGYDRLGWAVGIVQRKKLAVTSFGLVQTQKKDLLITRYQHILAAFTDLLITHQPSELAIEKVFFSKNTTTALQVAEVRGICIGAALLKNIAVHEYNPMTIKQTVTGYGKADKKAVSKMICLELKLNPDGLIDDTLDALGILLTHSLA